MYRALLVFTALIAAMPNADAAKVSIQLVNPDVTAQVLVFLDRTLIYDGLPTPMSAPVEGTRSVTIAAVEVDASRQHTLVAFAPASHAKAQLQWIPHLPSAAWVVIRYYPGQRSSEEPPFFIFSLQSAPEMKK